MRHVPQMDCAWTVMTAIKATSENKTFFIINLLHYVNFAKVSIFFNPKHDLIHNLTKTNQSASCSNGYQIGKTPKSLNAHLKKNGVVLISWAAPFCVKTPIGIR